MRTAFRSLAALAAFVAVLAATLVAPAQAAARGRHCVAEAQPLSVKATSKRVPPAMECFATFGEAISNATGGKVTTTADVGTAMTDEHFTEQVVSAANVLSVEYTDIDFGGASFTISGDCANGVGVNWVGDAWNDKVSSARSFNCYAVHWEDWNYGGTRSTGTNGDAGRLYDLGGGSFNDATSSISYQPVESGTPSRRQLVQDCNAMARSGGCVFQPTSKTEIYRGWAHVGSTVNCSSVTQQRSVAWTATDSTVDKASVEVGVTVGTDFLAKAEVSIKTTFGTEWTVTRTITDTGVTNVPPGKQENLWRSAKAASVSGRWQVRYSSPVGGHYLWYFDDVVEMPTTATAGNMAWTEQGASCLTGAQQTDAATPTKAGLPPITTAQAPLRSAVSSG